jgi:hypothetical protein
LCNEPNKGHYSIEGVFLSEFSKWEEQISGDGIRQIETIIQIGVLENLGGICLESRGNISRICQSQVEFASEEICISA